MKRAVTFYSEGVKLVGDVYLPQGPRAGEPRAAALPLSGATATP